MSEPRLHSFSTSRPAPGASGPDDTHDEDQTIIQNDTAVIHEAPDVDMGNDTDAESIDQENGVLSNDKDDADDETTENMEEEIRPDDNPIENEEQEQEEEQEEEQVEEVEELEEDDEEEEEDPNDAEPEDGNEDGDITSIDTDVKNKKALNNIAPKDVEEEEEEEDLSGTSALQLSKIKKIFKTDPEHISASEAAVFSTAVATELFIQYFTEQAGLIAKTEKRKKLQYHDFAAAVSNLDNLHFLGDLVPKTLSLQKLVEQDRVRLPKKDKNSTDDTTSSTEETTKALSKGQKVLNFSRKIIETESTDVTREGTAEFEQQTKVEETLDAVPAKEDQDEDVVMLDG